MDRKRLDPEELEAIESGRLPDTIHPHYPFVLIRQVLSTEGSALIYLWKNWPELRNETVARWCVMATTHPWAWDDCDALLRDLVWHEEEIPEPLRQYTRLKRPRRQGRRTTLARDLRVEESARLLERSGFSRSEAELAIALYLAHDSSGDGLDSSTVRKARNRARKHIEDIKSAYERAAPPATKAAVHEMIRRTDFSSRGN